MSRPKSYRAPSLDGPERLDIHLASAGVVPTRSQAKAWIDAGLVRVDGRIARASLRISGGEQIEIDPPPAAPRELVAEDLPLVILYSDEDVVAIDKPPGMVVHPAPGSPRGTLANALLHHGLVSGGALGDRPGIVHRLDKETSGVLVVARTPEAHDQLGRAFRERAVTKVYVALALGGPAAARGELTWTVGRHPRERKRMSTRSPKGRSAKTTFEVLERFEGVSLVRLTPETGRTHQIRVHLAAAGFPVVGDPLYGARRGRARPKSGPASEVRRTMLHALALELPHPRTGETLVVSAPPPEDFANALEALRKGTHLPC